MWIFLEEEIHEAVVALLYTYPRNAIERMQEADHEYANGAEKLVGGRVKGDSR